MPIVTTIEGRIAQVAIDRPENETLSAQNSARIWPESSLNSTTTHVYAASFCADTTMFSAQA